MMNKRKIFLENPKRRLKQLLSEMAERDIEREKQQIKRIIDLSRNKRIQSKLSRSHEVLQPPLFPTKQSYSLFINQQPISKGLKYLDSKIRNNILAPERFYSSDLNVKAGNYQLSSQNIQNDREITSRKFEEYNKIIDQQSGTLKSLRFRQINDNEITTPRRKKYMRMKQTLFQKFISDKYNFYDPIPVLNHETRSNNSKQSMTLKRLKSPKSISMIRCNTYQSTKNEEIIQEKSKTIQKQKFDGFSSRKLSAIDSINVKSRLKIKIKTKQKNVDSYSSNIAE